MQLDTNHIRNEQLELAERVTNSAHVPLRERPTADAELEAMFIRAASAWARWRERQRWGAH